MSNILRNDGSEERLSKGSVTIFDLAFHRFLKALEAGSNTSVVEQWLCSSLDGVVETEL